MGVAADAPQPRLRQGQTHRVLIIERHKHRQLVQGLPAGRHQNLHLCEGHPPGQVLVKALGGHVQVGVAGKRSQPSPDQGAEQLATGLVFTHLRQGLVKQGVMGQEELGPQALGFLDHPG